MNKEAFAEKTVLCLTLKDGGFGLQGGHHQCPSYSTPTLTTMVCRSSCLHDWGFSFVGKLEVLARHELLLRGQLTSNDQGEHTDKDSIFLSPSL